MILVDANVLMYAAGAPHPHRQPSLDLLEAIARGEVEAALDAEVLQEVLHRYRAIGRWQDGRTVYELARTVIPDVLDITATTTDVAKDLMDRYPHLMARDAIHAAAAFELAADAVCSWDQDFDGIEGLVRRDPSQVLAE